MNQFTYLDTTQWCRWGSNSRPLGLESSTLPLSRCAPVCDHAMQVKVAYISNVPPLVVEHALPLTGFVARGLMLQKFVFNWPNGFWENCFNKLMGLQYVRPWLKGQAWPLELIYSHCHIWLNISSENNDFGFNSFQKINFSKVPPI